MYEKGTFLMPLYGQLSINKMLSWFIYLNVGLIFSHTLDMVFKTNYICGFLGCGMFVSKHFLAPHTKTRWTLFSPNKNGTMGCKVFWLVMDQMAISNLELHNSKNLQQLGKTLTNLFPDLIARTMGFCLFWTYFKCDVSHSKPFIFKTKKLQTLLSSCMLGQKIKQTLASELRFTFFGVTWIFLSILPITILFL